MNTPTPVDPSPVPKVVKFDFRNVLKRLSTLMGVIVTAASSILTWYIQQPEYVQETFPDWVLSTASVISMAGIVLVPLATSYLQKNLAKE